MNNHYRDWPRGKCPGPLFNRHWPGQECWDKGILNINLVTNKKVHCVQIKNVLIFHAQVEQTPLWKFRKKHVRMSKGILLKWRRNMCSSGKTIHMYDKISYSRSLFNRPLQPSQESVSAI